MRRHKDPTKCPKPGRQLKPRRPPQPRQPPQPPQARGRCTRYVALHPLRGGAPEQKRCIAYGSGAVPQHTRTNAELAHRTTHRRTPPCAPGPYWRQDGHAAHATTCTPAHSGPLRHLLHPYMRRATFPHQHNEKSPLQQHVVSYNPVLSFNPRPSSRIEQETDLPGPPQADGHEKSTPEGVLGRNAEPPPVDRTEGGRCAPGGTRTPNLLNRNQMLYPLSYGRFAVWLSISLHASRRDAKSNDMA